METYQIDPSQTKVHFSVKHLMLARVQGDFHDLRGTLDYDPSDPSGSEVYVAIKTASISTKNDERDQAVRGPDFLDVQNNPFITFKSKRITERDAELQIIGDLTLHGITKTVTLNLVGQLKEFKDDEGLSRLTAHATTKINRKDFGLKWNAALEAGGLLVGDDVNIVLDVQFVKKVLQ